jgi:hypothetical protein
MSAIQSGANGTAGQNVDAFGIAFNINENLSVSYGERDVEFDNPSAA